MSSEPDEAPADARTIEDIIERGIGQMLELSKANATRLAAAATGARETRELIEALARRIDHLVPGHPAADAAAQEETMTSPSDPQDHPATDEGSTGAPPGRQGAGAQAAGEPEAEDEAHPAAAPQDGGEAAPAAGENGAAAAPAGGDDAGPAAQGPGAEAASAAGPAPAADHGTPAASLPPSPPAPTKREKKILRLLAKIDKRLARLPDPAPRQTEILEALGAIRTAQEAQNETITAAIALAGGAAGDDAGMPPAWQAFQEVMTRLDRIVGIIRPARPPQILDEGARTPPPGGSEPPALAPPEPPVDADEVRHAVDELLEAAARPRRAFIRFAWVSILVVTLCAGALGVVVQQRYTLLDPTNDTLGWKDRVWELAGEEIARCINAAADRGNRCAVTVDAGGTAPADEP